MVVDIAWASGLIEGEGCFTLHTGAPYFLLDSTDQDVVVKLHSIFPCTTMRGPYTDKSATNKPRWRVDAFGPKAVIVMDVVYPYMCSRRKNKIDELRVKYMEKLNAKENNNNNNSGRQEPDRG